MKRLLLILVVLLGLAGRLEAADLTVCSPGCTYTTVQAAVNAAVSGDRILITAGATFTENVVLPVKPGATFIRITSTASAGSLPPVGERTNPTYASFMPKIKAPAGGAPALSAAAGAHHYWIDNIEFLPNPGGFNSIITVGAGDGTQIIPSQQPHDIVFERVYAHGDPVYGQKRAWEIHGRDITVKDSYCEYVNAIGQDSQCIGGWNGTGPYTFTNNTLLDGTENLMLGGSDPRMKTWMTVSGTPTTTQATVSVLAGGYSLTDLKVNERISIMTASGIRHTMLRSVTGTSSGTITYDAIDVVPNVGVSTIRQDTKASDVLIRGNTFGKRTSYMTGILQPPTSVSATPNEATGTLAVGTWYYRIAAVNPAGYVGNEVWSSPSLEVSGVLTDPGQVALSWTNATGSDRVTIWRGTTPGGENQFVANVTGTSWTDTGAITWQPYSPGPPAARKWQVKNLLEIKAAQRVTITGNIFENAWKGSDIGFTAIWGKSVNQENTCWNCGSSDLLIEHNVFRHIFGFLELHGTEAAAGQVKPPPLTNVTVRNNLVYDSNSVRWGEGADQYAIYVGDYVVNLTLEHNTIDHVDRGFRGFMILDGVQGSNTGAVIRGNIMRRGTYGIHSDVGTGAAALAAYMPGAVWSTNVLEGANAAQYPATTFTPNDATYEASFVDYEEDGSNAISDWALAGASAYNNAAWDGTDIGVNMATLLEAIAGADETDPTSDLAILTTTIGNAVQGVARTIRLEAGGGEPNVGTTATISANSGATYSGFAETQIKEAAATTNYGSNVNCSIERWTTTDRTHCLVKATSLSSIPSNAVVTGARLRMYLNGAGQSGLSTNINVRKLLRNVNHAQATWNVFATGSAWGTVGGLNASDRSATISAAAAVTETLGYVTFTGTQLTADVQCIVATTCANYGWILERNDALADFQWRTFTSSEGTNGQRPVLEVDYIVGGPYGWSHVAGTLPAGWALNTETGDVGGTASTTGTYNFTIRVTDADPDMFDRAYEVIVRAPINISTTSLPGGTLNAPFCENLQASGDETPYTWTLDTTSAAPPPGVTLSAAGALCGTPSAIVVSSLVVKATGALGSIDTQGLTLTIIDGPTISLNNVTAAGDRLRLNYGPCTFSSGAGSPEGVLQGRPCDTYLDVSTGSPRTKWAGTGKTGWFAGFNSDARISGKLDLLGSVGHPDYVSQFARWNIDAAGNADFRGVFAENLRVRFFTAETQRAINGLEIIPYSSAKLAQPFTCPAPGGIAPLIAEDFSGYPGLQVFASGHWVAIRSFDRSGGGLAIEDCVGTVASPSTPGGTQQWTFTRGTSSSGGTMPTSTVIATGATALDYGLSGSGYLELNSVDGANGINAPYIQAATWSTAPTVGNRTLRYRCGNLRGVTAQAEYGCILGTYSSAGSAQYIRASDQAFEVRNINLSMFNGSTEVLRIDRTAPSFAMGATVPTAFGTGAGFWMGVDSGAFKARLGNPAGDRLEYNATTGVLAVYGDGTNMTVDGRNMVINSIDVGALNATGFGGNVIRNGTFEGATSAIGIAGWAVGSTGTAPSQNCCGTNGPGTFFFNQGNGGQSNAYYRAAPVIAGQTYRISADSYAVTTTTAGIGIRVYESTSTSSAATYVVASGATGSQVNATSNTALYTAGQTGSTWSTREFVYTVPAGVRWVSLFLANATGSVSGSTYSDLHFDNIEMQLQIGAGHVRANSITVDKLFATSLSSITANLGTVTGGSFTGVTGTFGGGTMVLGPTGMSITQGTTAAHKITFTGAGEMYGNGSNDLIIASPDSISLQAPGPSSILIGSGVINLDPGSGGSIGTHFVGGGTRFVCVNDSGVLFSQVAPCN